MRARKLATVHCSCDACGRSVKVKARSIWSASGALTRRGWVTFGARSALCPSCSGRRKPPKRKKTA